jgi:RHS repeat-associated protein
LTYDDASQLTRVAYPGGPTLDYAYDETGRLLTTDGLTLQYDARGDVVGSIDGSAEFGATYDAGQRLSTVTYAGRATVTYHYDERDLLVRVEDDLAGAWLTLGYDDEGRLLALSRSNGVRTAFSHDDAGRVTGIRDETGSETLAEQHYRLNAEGEPLQVSRSLPLDPPPDLPILSLSYDDASQIDSADYAYDAAGRQTTAPGAAPGGGTRRYAYDGASRLTSIVSGTETVTFTYNGAHDLVGRTAGGATTAYHHNYALQLAPIVAESGEPGVPEGAYKRFYVYTPDGELLYSLDPATRAVRFHHYDRVGSTLFLTDGSGAMADAYCYDPYGMLLGHTGASDQPFTYVGRFGVRWEPVGGLYDMRARYYDPASARFLSRDPAWPELEELLSLNPYAYAAQNPLRYIDPEGTLAEPGTEARKRHDRLVEYLAQLLLEQRVESWADMVGEVAGVWHRSATPGMLQESERRARALREEQERSWASDATAWLERLERESAAEETRRQAQAQAKARFAAGVRKWHLKFAQWLLLRGDPTAKRTVEELAKQGWNVAWVIQEGPEAFLAEWKKRLR